MKQSWSWRCPCCNAEYDGGHPTPKAIGAYMYARQHAEIVIGVERILKKNLRPENKVAAIHKLFQEAQL